MLQDCYDSLQARKVAALEATEEAKNRMVSLRGTMRDIRSRVIAPTVAIAEPEAFPMEEKDVPPGDPFTLNPQVAMAKVGRKRSAAAPLVIPVSVSNKHQRVQEPTKKAKASKLPEGITFNVICKKCGGKKSDHGSSKQFGSNCIFRYCARCGESLAYHQSRGLKMGFYCSVQIAPAREAAYEESLRR